jgi:hypothetical protein
MPHKTHMLVVLAMSCSMLLNIEGAWADMSINTFERNIAAGGAPALAARYHINGIEDGLSWANVASGIRIGVKLYCPPSDLALTDDQIIDILRRFVRTNTSINVEQDRVGSILLIALQQLFPCQQPGNSRR